MKLATLKNGARDGRLVHEELGKDAGGEAVEAVHGRRGGDLAPLVEGSAWRVLGRAGRRVAEDCAVPRVAVVRHQHDAYDAHLLSRGACRASYSAVLNQGGVPIFEHERSILEFEHRFLRRERISLCVCDSCTREEERFINTS